VDEEWKKTLNIWTNISETIVAIPLKKWEPLFLKPKNTNRVKKENRDQNQERWIMWIRAFLEASNLQIRAEAPFIHQLEILQGKVWTAEIRQEKVCAVFLTKVGKNRKERKKNNPQIITNHTIEELNHFYAQISNKEAFWKIKTPVLAKVIKIHPWKKSNGSQVAVAVAKILILITISN